MSKFAILAVCFALIATVIQAEPPRYRTSRRNGALRTNIRFLARQEAAAPAPAPDSATSAPAPYPPAGVTPEVPFDLPTETEAVPAAQPDQAYGPPDQTYGPPETATAPEEADAPVQPNNIYGPPENTQLGVEEPDTVAVDASQSLIQPRGRNLRLSVVPAPQQLAPRAGLVEIIRSEPILVYTL